MGSLVRLSVVFLATSIASEFATVHCDWIYLLEENSVRGGKNPDYTCDSIDVILSEILFSKDRVVLYLDALWSIDSKRRAFPIIQAVREYVEDTTPIYVLNQENWEPNSIVFQEWWKKQQTEQEPGTAPIPDFVFTKYRSILLVIKKGKLALAFLNFAAGEGGPECVSHLILDALDDKEGISQSAPQQSSLFLPEVKAYCDAFAKHTQRKAAGPWLGSSYRGWTDVPPGREVDILPLFPSFGVHVQCGYYWGHVPEPEDEGEKEELWKSISDVDMNDVVAGWYGALRNEPEWQNYPAKVANEYLKGLVRSHLLRSLVVAKMVSQLSQVMQVIPPDCTELSMGHVVYACDCLSRLVESVDTTDSLSLSSLPNWFTNISRIDEPVHG
mmetsp:Transcript_6563/g.18563  ORF Transcript_6563/g.18563 Transcript_6563/m.18563 type:complete len:385 (-) Transcript_6563:292-1446(-)|eukprot:CAMPEP_0119135864 /NCGR_PEP_ID=MMETSP1310-20130426/20214_1 /TAXON_ID=464262 /ORGANISM="Genus nov. species nov., Strain RCC2339" /LENGTH=384 /DNA_ID=CAMNT_0007126809 /DNA_START=162 /DNA_END=1316 /DNA_ORIENTATION=-